MPKNQGPANNSVAALSAENTFTTPVNVTGLFNLSITGIWVGTITIQRSFDSGTVWKDVNTFTANTEAMDIEPEGVVVWRAGFKTGQYTSGTANVRISQ